MNEVLLVRKIESLEKAVARQSKLLSSFLKVQTKNDADFISEKKVLELFPVTKSTLKIWRNGREGVLPKLSTTEWRIGETGRGLLYSESAIRRLYQ